MLNRLDSEIKLLFSTLRRYDPYTASHCVSVANLSYMMAPIFDCSKDDLFLSGLLHDVGKLYTPLFILQKPEALTPEEFEVIKLHPVHGYEMAQHHATTSINFDVLHAILYHHERMDGNGYPHNLTNNNIPRLARIISVLDAYDSMTSRRPYRSPMSTPEALDILNKAKGTQFDPDIVDRFSLEITRSKCKKEPLFQR